MLHMERKLETNLCCYKPRRLRGCLLLHHTLAKPDWFTEFNYIWLLNTKNENSHLYMTTGKTIALTIQTLVNKVMSLLFSTLSRFVITFLPRSKRLLVSWLKSPSTVILESKKIKSATVSIFFFIYLPQSGGTRYRDLSFFNVEFQASFFTLFFHLPQEAL